MSTARKRNLGRATGLLTAASIVLAAVVVPIAPRLGYSLESRHCEQSGVCRQLEELTASCSDRGSAWAKGGSAIPIAAQTRVGGSTALITRADGTAAVTTGRADRYEIQRFPDSSAALRWLVGRDRRADDIADASFGPASHGASVGLHRIVGGVGVGGQQAGGPASALTKAEVAGNAAVVSSGKRTRTTWIFHSGQDIRGALPNLMAWLGLKGERFAAVETGADGAPQVIELGGQADPVWSIDSLGDGKLRSLPGPSQRARVAEPEGPDDSGDTVLRRYRLDLTTDQGKKTAELIFGSRIITAEGEITVPFGLEDKPSTEANLAAFGSALARRGIFFEARYSTAGAASSDGSSASAALVGMPLDQPGTFELTNAWAYDFAAPREGRQRLLGCDEALE